MKGSEWNVKEMEGSDLKLPDKKGSEWKVTELKGIE